ncbi:hypothetical protein JHK87_050753 [Glycine soja]|nr:hypothetical protein JHK87_050753 [Glycine soja]
MAQTKHALYVDGCDPFHEGLDLSHERDDAGERHQRLIASTHDRQHPPTEDHCVGHVWIWQLRLEMKLVSHGGQVLPFPIEPTVRAFVSWSRLLALVMTWYLTANRGFMNALVERWHKEISSFHLPVEEMTITLDDVLCLLHLPMTGRLIDHVPSTFIRNTVKILLMTHLGINSKEEAIAATIASVGVRLLPVQANGGVEGHDALPMQGPSLFDFWDRLTAVLKANGGAKGDNALPCKGLLCSIFFFALVLILLWTGKSYGLCLIPTRLTAVLKVTVLCHARAFFVRFFFHLGFNIALDGKEANGGAEGDDVLLDLFFISKNICDFFLRKLLFSGRLKEGEAASEKVTNNYHVLRQIE